MRERREFQRRRTFLGGRLAFNNQYGAIDCLVRNMSQNGALISTPPRLSEARSPWPSFLVMMTLGVQLGIN
jgi:hypothetical protein